jgi:hypothetical protein
MPLLSFITAYVARLRALVKRGEQLPPSAQVHLQVITISTCRRELLDRGVRVCFSVTVMHMPMVSRFSFAVVNLPKQSCWAVLDSEGAIFLCCACAGCVRGCSSSSQVSRQRCKRGRGLP